MRDRIRYAAQMPIVELESEYRERYRGYEADIRFNPMLQNMLTFDFEIGVPHMITVDDELKREFERVLERAIREAVYTCGRIAADIAAKRKANLGLK